MGGLGGPFLGLGLLDFFHDGSCAFSSSTGLVTCGKQTRGGLTITHTFKYTDVGGNPQPKIDSTTNTIASTGSVVGPVTRPRQREAQRHQRVERRRDRAARGGSTQRGRSIEFGWSENTSGRPRWARPPRTPAGDTITGVVIPVGTAALSHPPYPSAGTIIRSMTVTVTLSGQSPATSSRREVITYDGSATAKVVITADGTTQNCTLPLPFGRLSCQ
jgi:hypothetical protein